jgi:hypothetical protein
MSLSCPEGAASSELKRGPISGGVSIFKITKQKGRTYHVTLRVENWFVTWFPLNKDLNLLRLMLNIGA